jgi:hypothetical protein
MGDRGQNIPYKPSEAIKFDIFKIPIDESYNQSKKSDHSLQNSVKEFNTVPKRSENDQ